MPSRREDTSGREDGSSDGAPEPPAAANRTRDAIGAAAYVLRNRERFVREGLLALRAAGLIHPDAAEALWERYRRSDARTRLALQELLARVLRVPLDFWDPNEALGVAHEEAPDAKQPTFGGAVDESDLDAMAARYSVDAARVSAPDLERLRATADGHYDPTQLGDRIRGLDIDRFFHDDKPESEVSPPLRLIADVPLRAQRLRRALQAGGVVLILLVASALAFPEQARLVLFYGFLTIVIVFALLMLKWARDIHKAFERFDVDLGALVKLSPSERRLLLGRRLVMRVLDPHHMADIWERLAHFVIPEVLLHEDPDHPHRREARAKAAQKAAEAEQAAAEEELKAQRKEVKERRKAAKAERKATEAEAGASRARQAVEPSARAQRATTTRKASTGRKAGGATVSSPDRRGGAADHPAATRPKPRSTSSTRPRVKAKPKEGAGSASTSRRASGAARPRRRGDADA